MSLGWLPDYVIRTEDEEDRKILKAAYINASKLSSDPSTTNGSVILVDDEAIERIDAANYFPSGILETEARWQRPLKYEYVEHAERNAIYAAALHGVSLQDSEMYCTWYACVDCARAIIQSGIKRVVGHAAMYDNTPDRWRETILRAFDMLHEAGVECVVYVGKVFTDENFPELRFNGEKWEP